MEKLKKINPFSLNTYERLILKGEFSDDFHESFIKIFVPLFKLNNIEYDPNLDDSDFFLFLILNSYKKKEKGMDDSLLIADFEKYCNRIFMKTVIKAEDNPTKSILIIFKERHQKRMTNMKNVISYEESVKKLFG